LPSLNIVTLTRRPTLTAFLVFRHTICS